MKALQFNFENPSEKDKAVKTVIQRFRLAGASVVTSEVDKTMSRRAGVTFRNLNLTFADGQTVTMAFKATGDVFEVRVNGKVTPLKDQDDYHAAISEIAGRMDSGRDAFQRALARVKVPLPPSIRTSRANLLKAKVDKRDALKEVIVALQNELQSLTSQPATTPS